MKNSSTFDYSVFIGRFQPFHKGHLTAVKQAFNKSKHVIILVGSAFSAPNIRNPFSFEQRREMITSNLIAAGHLNFTILPIRDYYYSDDAWTAEVQRLVKTVAGNNSSILLFGHKKDSTSYYLDLFPQWSFADIESDFVINATDIRNHYLSGYGVSFYNSPYKEEGKLLQHSPTTANLVEEPTKVFLQNFLNTEKYNYLSEEFKEMQEYKKAWNKAPYPPVFVTTDAVVTCCGHVLLVTRKANPGKGLYALPGGFVNQEEPLEVSCLRELREETRIKVPTPVLRGSIVAKNVFDHPLRSVRGRTVTHAFYIQLKDTELPKIKGGDDAENAFWMPLSEVFKNPESFFEDHLSIIESFIGRGV